MNNVSKMVLGAVFTAISMTSIADGHGKPMGLTEGPNEKLAVAWVTAAYTGMDETLAMVKENMAEDGILRPDRYVGFGFQLDPNNEDEMTVVRVTPDTPASEVLKEGDVFVSVAGVPATYENRDKMSFRGKPGEPVKAVIRRDGKEMAIEVKRGIIATTTSKEQLLKNIPLGDRENWGVDSFQIDEVLSEGNVTYVVSSYTDTEDDTGIEYTERTMTRFVFDDDGKVSWVGGLGESRFVLEQQGYTITR
jgi:hypothetical protein